MLNFLFAFMCVVDVYANLPWWEIPRSEDQEAFYYVGSSEGDQVTETLRDQAFNRALTDLIRENFGMKLEISETIIEDFKNDQLQVILKQNSAPLYIKGISIQKIKEVETKLGTRLFVQVKVSRKDISESLKLISLEEGSFNIYGEKSDNRISVKVRSNPAEAMIQLTHQDMKFSIQGQGHALFHVPPGKYVITLFLEGYKTESSEVALLNDGLELQYSLEELTADVEFYGYPIGTKIEISGRPLKSDQVNLNVSRTYALKASHPDYFEHREEFKIDGPISYRKELKLRPRPSTISLKVFPQDAELEIDGSMKRLENDRVFVSAGYKKLKISASGYEDFEETIFVGPNRDYPLKEIKLVRSKIIEPDTPSELTFRFEYNPLARYGDDDLFLHIPLSFYLEKSFLSLGVSYAYANDVETRKENELNRNFYFTDTSASIRLLTPKFSFIEFYASYSIGQYSFIKEYGNQHRYKKTAEYHGPGGGMRLWFYQAWSMHVEYHQMEVKFKETGLKEKDGKFVLGIGLQF